MKKTILTQKCNFIIVATLLLLSMKVTKAQSVGEKFEVDKLYYQITNVENKAVAATYQSEEYPFWDESKAPKGFLNIPKTVSYKDNTYSVTSISMDAFADLLGITSVNIPNTVDSIGMAAFTGCLNMTSLVIPNSVKKIRGDAFSVCENLRSIFSYIEDLTAVRVDSFAFAEVKRDSCILYVPVGKVDDYKNGDHWNEFSKIYEIQAIESFVLNEKSKSLKEGEAFQLSVQIKPEKGTNKNLIWKSSSPSVASVNNGKVVGLSIGKTVITVTSVDGTKSDTCKVSVTVGNSVNSKLLTKNINMYPSVVSNKITVEIEGVSDSKLEIYNLLGNKVYEKKLNNEKEDINVDFLKSGIYIVYIDGQSKKIIKN